MDRKAVVTAIWWRCYGDSDSLPELAPCDVLASTPEAAAREYARGAHEEIAPEDLEVITEVHVSPLEGEESAECTDETEWPITYRVTTRREYRAVAAEMERQR